MKPATKTNTKITADTASNHNDGIPISLTNGARASVHHRKPEFTLEETIVLRALAGGKSDKQVCTELRMPSGVFHRLLRDLREKTGVADHLSLLVWALRQMKSGECRVNHRDGYPCSISEPV